MLLDVENSVGSKSVMLLLSYIMSDHKQSVLIIRLVISLENLRYELLCDTADLVA